MLALLGGFALEVLGVTALAVGAAVIVVLPVAWFAARGQLRPMAEAA